MKNEYIPHLSTILEVIKHTELEYTFRMEYTGDVKPGQFFELSLPKYGEAPISVSGIGEGTVDFTIRRVGKVTNEIFENYVGDRIYPWPTPDWAKTDILNTEMQQSQQDAYRLLLIPAKYHTER